MPGHVRLAIHAFTTAPYGVLQTSTLTIRMIYENAWSSGNQFNTMANKSRLLEYTAKFFILESQPQPNEVSGLEAV